MNSKNNIAITNNIKIGGNNKLVLLAGPCAIENLDFNMEMAKRLKEICILNNVDLIYKSSFDKANRSSINSFRSVGLEKGLEILHEIKEETKIPVITDIHEPGQAQKVAEVVDIIQIPAFLCRQTDLIVASAKTMKPVMIKKGQFLAPWDMKNAINKMLEIGNKKILLCERGTSFGYNNYVVDMRALLEMGKFGYPVVFDATHSVQIPGGLGCSTGGNRAYVFPLMRAAVAVGIDALFAEIHSDPDNAPCDGPNMLKLEDLDKILKHLNKINALERNE